MTPSAQDDPEVGAHPQPAAPAPGHEEWHAIGAAIGTGLRGMTEMVADTHSAIADRVETYLPDAAVPVMAAQRTIADGVYRTVGLAHQGIPTVLGWAVGRALREMPAPSSTPVGKAVLPAANGLWGDHLHRTAPVLAIRMHVRVAGEDLHLEPAAVAAAFPAATPRVVVLVHGLGGDERWWNLTLPDTSDSYPSLLAREGLTCVTVRYNAGRRISDNGRDFAALLAALVAAWPVPVESVALVGHSMGGLVSRSAAHQGSEQGLAWVDQLDAVISLGSPHLGAPLEKAAHAADRALRVLPESAPISRPLSVRSVGIRDLRHGAIVEADWSGHDPDAFGDPCTDVPLLAGVRYHWVASTLAPIGHPVGRALGDGMVRVGSASGEGRRRRIGFDSEHGVTLGSVDHLRLVHDPQVYAHLARWLTQAPID